MKIEGIRSVSHCKESDLSGCHDLRVRYILQIIETRLSDQNLTVIGIAKAVRLSPTRVRSLMQMYLGETPKHFIVTRRMLKAEFLLSTTFLSIKETMAAVGMNDPTHFSREFKRLFGMAPRQYRIRTSRLQLGAYSQKVR